MYGRLWGSERGRGGLLGPGHQTVLQPHNCDEVPLDDEAPPRLGDLVLQLANDPRDQQRKNGKEPGELVVGHLYPGGDGQKYGGGPGQEGGDLHPGEAPDLGQGAGHQVGHGGKRVLDLAHDRLDLLVDGVSGLGLLLGLLLVSFGLGGLAGRLLLLGHGLGVAVDVGGLHQAVLVKELLGDQVDGKEGDQPEVLARLVLLGERGEAVGGDAQEAEGLELEDLFEDVKPFGKLVVGRVERVLAVLPVDTDDGKRGQLDAEIKVCNMRVHGVAAKAVVEDEVEQEDVANGLEVDPGHDLGPGAAVFGAAHLVGPVEDGGCHEEDETVEASGQLLDAQHLGQHHAVLQDWGHDELQDAADVGADGADDVQHHHGDGDEEVDGGKGEAGGGLADVGLFLWLPENSRHCEGLLFL